MSGETAAPEIGNTLPLQNIPVGTVIHNIELRPGQGAALVRSAGNFAQLTSREGKYCVIKLPSGEVRQILSTCKATIGSVGNSDHGLERSGKAGRSRWQGRRPRNRGVVMNPVDHPMGGGEGRSSGGHPDLVRDCTLRDLRLELLRNNRLSTLLREEKSNLIN